MNDDAIEYGDDGMPKLEYLSKLARLKLRYVPCAAMAYLPEDDWKASLRARDAAGELAVRMRREGAVVFFHVDYEDIASAPYEWIMDDDVTEFPGARWISTEVPNQIPDDWQ
ncbi:hypothetical protein [Streptomyces sp. L2]|uniref:hypothetical protein n=1 Tax=Streptomyces sp. L2 TaxID=2162665 RepID=UPI00101265F8|nr:hypothetical protein [Streptomyces sp. L2]